MPYQL